MSSSKASGKVVVITDTSCLIILDKLSLLNILNQLFESILTTPEIAGEYGKPLPDWIVILPAKNKSLQSEFSFLVDMGEASAIALALEIENNYLITDDLEARKLSAKLGLAIIGSLGVLLRAKEAGYIDLVKPYILQMKQTNFRVSDDLYQTVLRKANEE